MSSKEIIINSLEYVKNNYNIKIIRGNGALYNWCKYSTDLHGRQRSILSDLPTECDGVGAILLANNMQHLASPKGFKKGWLKELCNLLEEDTYWLWKFMCGWNGRVLIIETDKSKEKDPISLWSNKTAKQYVGQ